jgi:hypothetical protein
VKSAERPKVVVAIRAAMRDALDVVDVKIRSDRAAFAVVQSFGALVAVSLEDSLPGLAPLARGAAAAGPDYELAVLRAPTVVCGVFWTAWFGADSE